MSFRPFVVVLPLILSALPVAAQDAQSYSETPAPSSEADQPAPEAKAVKGKKKADKAKKKGAEKYDYEKSKYKAVVETPPSVYRYNSKGEPVVEVAKKKKKGKKAKNSSEASEEGGASSEEGEKKSSEAGCEENQETCKQE
jgi:hypothetical protein